MTDPAPALNIKQNLGCGELFSDLWRDMYANHTLRRGARARDDLKNCLVVYTVPRINFAEIIRLATSDLFFRLFIVISVK